MPVDRDHLGHPGEEPPRCAQGRARFGWPLAPGGMPQVVVLDVEEDSPDGPVKHLAKVARVAVAPVRPQVAPLIWLRSLQRESCREKGPVIVGELEPVVPLDPCELRIGQARPDFVLACPGQQAGGFLAQPCRVTADHPVTVAAAGCRSGHCCPTGPGGNKSVTRGTHPQGGAAAPDPAAYGLSPPLFQPLTAYAARGRIFPAPARGIPHPDRRAISVQLAPATSGLSRSLADTPTRRSGHVKGRSRTDSQADHAVSLPPR